MGIDHADPVLLYVIAATAALLLWALVVYMIEIRRAGSTPWTEWYNDRVLPMYRGRHGHT